MRIVSDYCDWCGKPECPGCVPEVPPVEGWCSECQDVHEPDTHTRAEATVKPKETTREAQ